MIFFSWWKSNQTSVKSEGRFLTSWKRGSGELLLQLQLCFFSVDMPRRSLEKKVSQCWQRRNCGSHRQGSFFRSSRSIYQERNLLKSSTLFMLSFAVEVEVRCVLKQSIEGINVIYKNELHKRLKKWLCRQQQGPSKLCRELCCENT